MSEEIFLWIEQTKAGPFTWENVVQMWRMGQVTGETLHWQDGWEKWLPLSESGLAAKLQQLEDLQKAQVAATAAARRIEEAEEFRHRVAALPVSTGDLPMPYDVLGPVYFSMTNRGVFSSQYEALRDKHSARLQTAISGGHVNHHRAGMSDLFLLWCGDFNASGRNYEQALFVAVEEMRERAVRVGATGAGLAAPRSRHRHQGL